MLDIGMKFILVQRYISLHPLGSLCNINSAYVMERYSLWYQFVAVIQYRTGSLAGTGNFLPRDLPLKKRQANNRGLHVSNKIRLATTETITNLNWPLPKHSRTIQKPKSPPQNKSCSGWENNKEKHFMSVITICKENPTLRKEKKKRRRKKKSMQIIV